MGMTQTPIFDALQAERTAQQNAAAAATPAPDKAEDKAHGLPWLRIFRG